MEWAWNMSFFSLANLYFSSPAFNNSFVQPVSSLKNILEINKVLLKLKKKNKSCWCFFLKKTPTINKSVIDVSWQRKVFWFFTERIITSYFRYMENLFMCLPDGSASANGIASKPILFLTNNSLFFSVIFVKASFPWGNELVAFAEKWTSPLTYGCSKIRLKCYIGFMRKIYLKNG